MKRKLDQLQEEKSPFLFNKGSGGDGSFWYRGPVIGEGLSASVHFAKSKKRDSFSYPPLLAVKSAKVSKSVPLQSEKKVYNDLKKCPNIIYCYGDEITTDDNGKLIYNLILEYASGGNLANRINYSGKSGFPEIDVRYYTRSILSGIKHIHDCGYVHSDLLPQNILLVQNSNDSKFIAKIGDFGMTKKAEDKGEDIWALGGIVFELFTGKTLWDHIGIEVGEENMMDYIDEDGEIPRIPEKISKDGRNFLRKCLMRKEYIIIITAKELLKDPFVNGLDEDVFEDIDS